MSSVTAEPRHRQWLISYDVLFWSESAKPMTLQSTTMLHRNVYSIGWSIAYSICVDTIRRRRNENPTIVFLIPGRNIIPSSNFYSFFFKCLWILTMLTPTYFLDTIDIIFDSVSSSVLLDKQWLFLVGSAQHRLHLIWHWCRNSDW